MMRLYKIVNNGYIGMVGIGSGGTEITETEYNAILNTIHNRPVRAGYGYRLRTDMTWEEFALEPPDPDPDIDDLTALEILMGGAV